MEDLSPKEKGFVNDFIDTGNATEAAARNYNVANRNVAGVIGWENLRKPKIQAMIQDASEQAFSTVLALSQGAENEAVRLNASKDIMDRAGFKPVDRQELAIKELPAPILGYVQSNNSTIKDNSTE